MSPGSQLDCTLHSTQHKAHMPSSARRKKQPHTNPKNPNPNSNSQCSPSKSSVSRGPRKGNPGAGGVAAVMAAEGGARARGREAGRQRGRDCTTVGHGVRGARGSSLGARARPPVPVLGAEEPVSVSVVPAVSSSLQPPVITYWP
jgi:hypothetical protein